MTDRIDEASLPLVSAAPTDELRAVRGGKSVRVPIVSLPASAAVQEQIDALIEGQQAGQLVYRTWAELSGVTGSVGEGAQVIDDTGTHTDPVVGGTVDNAGQYVWSESPAGWRWVRPDALPLKADRSELDHRVQRRNAPPYMAVADESGFSRFWGDDTGFGTPDAWVGAGGLRTPSVSLLSDGDPGLVVMDRDGFIAARLPAGSGVTALSDDGGDSGGGSAVAKAYPRLPMPSIRIVSHGGRVTGSSAPIDSLDAIRHAADRGFKFVEFDVRRTGDGEYVVAHDNDLNPRFRNASDYSEITPGTKLISALDLDDLRSDYVLSSTVAAFRRPIPTLEEALRLCRARGLHPVLDIKMGTFDNAHMTPIYNLARRIMGEANVTVVSFNYSQIEIVRSLSDVTPVEWLVSTFDEDTIPAVAALAPCALSMQYTDLTQAIVDDAKAAGVEVTCYTAPASAFGSLLALGVDGITTEAIAPEAERQQVAFSINSGQDFVGFASPATPSGGVLSLASGESVNLVYNEAQNVGAGCIYAEIEFSGAANISAGPVSASVSHSGFGNYNVQAMFNGAAGFVVTAGTGGCAIRNIAIQITQN